ncbi:RnfABCDGE type electron transport complex subunit B [Thermosipho ferrireducens]|uniref:RnfABCDGE type electron transport complex subunit B n=1 Tax=Thermosipho ferrireducens TaxID=2571116 RepID=A0ABX7S7A5_9BACT|nr:RnfABCDGE type electron transport complex subunit B [Thermosipho ferrireducens]QTA37670.1 RnfABCDGE type electron transport complex subunit B [Thermosipho ferrireducens]
MVVVYSALVMGALGLAFGLFLAYSNEKFKVEEDPKVKMVLEVLPGINCGACGYPGCEGYANAVVKKGDSYDKCLPGRKSGVTEKIKEIMES